MSMVVSSGVQPSLILPNTPLGVKYACAACIRGHRTSSCTHKDGSKGPLYPIRSKGRPATQCEICRKKRKTTGRHVRCDCEGGKQPLVNGNSHSISDYSSQPRTLPTIRPAPPSKRRRTSADKPFAINAAPIQEVSSHTMSATSSPMGALLSMESEVGGTEETYLTRSATLSLSSLMNPCGCKSTRVCACCRDRDTSHAATAFEGSSLPNEETCDPSKCQCSGDCTSNKSAPLALIETPPSKSPTRVQANAKAPTKGSGECCSKTLKPLGGANRAAPSIELLLKAVDMSAEFEPPACGCGENCRCARCLSRPNAHTEDCRTKTNAAPMAEPDSGLSPPAALLSNVAGETDESASGCDDCAACDLGLERPSGIGAVDAWLDKEKSAGSDMTNLTSSLSSPIESLSNAPPAQIQTETTSSILDLHGGMLTPQPIIASHGNSLEDDSVRAELVLVHPKCVACLQVVRNKGVGVLSSVS